MDEAAAALLPWRFAEGADGRLIIRKADTDSGIAWAKLRIVSVTEESGVYTADLGAVTATFTVTQQGDDLYRMESIELSQK